MAREVVDHINSQILWRRSVYYYPRTKDGGIPVGSLSDLTIDISTKLVFTRKRLTS